MSEERSHSRPGPDPALTSASAEVMHLIGELEAHHPVERWRSAGLDVWPIARIRLGHAAFRHLDNRPPRPARVDPAAAVRRGVAAVAGAAKLAGRGRAGAGSGQKRPAPVVLVSDGHSFSETAEGWVDRHCDPLRWELGQRGVASALLVPGFAAPRGLSGPLELVQPRLDLAAASARLRPAPVAELPGHASAQETAGRLGFDGMLPTGKALAYAAAAVVAMARVWEQLLHRYDAQLGCVTEYYALHGMAFVLACQRIGVPSIDIQHGVQGHLHPAYASWPAGCAGGPLLPDRFWVWSDEEADTVAAWASQGRERTIVGGNLWLRAWRQGTAPGFDAAVAEVDSLLARRRAQVLVLVALSGEEDQEARHNLLQAMREGPDEWLWALRCHPLDPGVKGWTEQARAMGLANVEVARSTVLPLFALLSRASVALTRHSSVTLDAAGFGVRTVLIDPSGAALYQRQIARGEASLAEPSPASIVAGLRKALDAAPLAVHQEADSESAVHDLLALSKGAA